MSIKVMSLNIWNYNPPWETRRGAIVSAIKAERPDIIALQEIRHDVEKDAKGTNQAEQLARRLSGYEMIYQPANPMPGRGWEGLALLSRHRILRGARIDLSRDPTDLEDRHQRIVLAAEVATPEGSLTCFNTHLSLSASARIRTVREVVQFVRQFAGEQPLVLMGDFNDQPQSESMAFLRRHFNDIWQTLHPGEPGETWHSARPQRRIDYLFASEGVGLLACHLAAWTPETGEVYASDHRGVVARITLAAGRGAARALSRRVE
jgi:endonuclease/exonuclease/phosphatase family metal-dependent hydrolase